MLKIKNTISKLFAEKKFLRSTKSGTSLLIGLGLTTIIVLVSIGVTTVVISSIRESANVTGANKAYYAAEGALEKGLLVNQDKGAGYSASDHVSTKAPQSDYTITGQVPPDINYYSDKSYGIPTPGTGNAGKDCDSVKPDVKDYFNFNATTDTVTPVLSGGTYPPQDNPCNWNKLKVGESVSIPLYYTDSSDVAQNILGTSNYFKIRVRTGCSDGKSFCSTRPKLDTTKGDLKYNYDDPIITWQIVGESPDGSKTYTLNPYLLFDNAPMVNDWKIASSIIYEKKINTTSTNEVVVIKNPGGSLGVDSVGCRGPILNYITKQNASTGCADITVWGSQEVKKPVLNLSVIHSLDEFGKDKIPYLEYQILTDTPASAPPTDTSQTITASGYSGTFKQVLEVKNPQESGLLQYVIQQ